MIVQFLCAGLVIVGITLMFTDRLQHIVKAKKRQTLAEYKAMLTGQKKQGLISRNLSAVQLATGDKKAFSKVKKLCLITGAIGFVFALYINNIYALPVLSLIGYLVPLWTVKYRHYTTEKVLAADISRSISLITTSYLRCDNITVAVTENIDKISPTLRRPYQKFIAECKFIDADIDKALQHLQDAFNHDIFIEWVRSLRKCIGDTGLKQSLQPIIAKFSDYKDVQLEVDTLMHSTFLDFVILASAAIINIPLISFFNANWYASLVNNTIGKIIIVFTIVSVMLGANKAIDLLAPVSLKR